MRQKTFFRRLGLAAVALALPLSASATLASATTTTPAPVETPGHTPPVTPEEAEAARQAADEAEAEAEAALQAVDDRKAEVPVKLAIAQKARERYRKAQKPVDRLKKRVDNRRKKVANAKTKKARKAARKQLKKARANLKSKRAVLQRRRKAQKVAWDAWRQAKTDRDDAIAYAPLAAERAVALREEADRLTALTTPVTSVKSEMLPPIRQASATTAAANDAARVLSVEVRPVRQYLPVEVQRLDDDTWTTVATGETRTDGRVDVEIPSAGEYRAVVNGVESATVTDTWSLKYSDEFNGARLSSDWTHRMQHLNPGGGRSCAQGHKSATEVKDGTLRLKVLKNDNRNGNCTVKYNGDNYPGHSYRYNGHVGTQTSFAFTYGVAAARIKWQNASEGQHGAFWLQPMPGEGTAAEIDVVEFNGYKPHVDVGRLYHTVWENDELTKPGQERRRATSGFFDERLSDYLADKDDKWFNRYHVFSVDWTPQGYVFRIDGVETWRTSRFVSERDQFLILSLLSSDWEIARAGAAGERTLGSQKIDVDWVRVWQE